VRNQIALHLAPYSIALFDVSGSLELTVLDEVVYGEEVYEVSRELKRQVYEREIQSHCA